MEAGKKKTGPKPRTPRDKNTHKPLLVREFPITLRNDAKYAASKCSITFREFVIQALTEKIEATTQSS